jgi:hypothetical protein
VQICNFMEKYGSLQLFPIKVQVPLIMSLRATLHVKNIQLWGGGPPSTYRSIAGHAAVAANGTAQGNAPSDIDFWEPPAHYKHVSIDELDAQHVAKRAAAKRVAREKKEEAYREKKRSAAGSSSSRHA